MKTEAQLYSQDVAEQGFAPVWVTVSRASTAHLTNDPRQSQPGSWWEFLSGDKGPPKGIGGLLFSAKLYVCVFVF